MSLIGVCTPGGVEADLEAETCYSAGGRTMAVIDTACLKGLAGGHVLDNHAEVTGRANTERPSSEFFTGVDPSAPVRALTETEIKAGIDGTEYSLRFHRVDKQIPMLMSLEQLVDLDAVIHVKDKTIDFRAIGK